MHLLKIILVGIVILATVPSEADARLAFWDEREPNDTQERATVLRSGALVRGTIEEDDVDWFSFVATRGDTVRIGQGEADVLLEGWSVIDSDGNKLSSRQHGDFLFYDISANGEYFIRQV